MKNDYEIRGDVTAIIIYSTKYGSMETIISTSNLQRVNEFTGTWNINYNKSTKSFYVQGNVKKVNGFNKTVSLHRLITSAPSHLVVDHINHDTLNNTDDNLRLITNAENMQNRKGSRCNSSSGVRGVSWSKKHKKWVAEIKVNKNRYYLGWFENLDDAANAVISAREEMVPFSREATQKRMKGDIA